MRDLRRWLPGAVWAVLAGMLLAPPAGRAAPTETGPLDERPSAFVPRRPRSEAEEQRLRAVSLYAAGRAAFQKEDYPRALRLYARSVRWDPDAHGVRREIAPLAFTLQRPAMGVRYALADVERSDVSADQLDLVRRLADHLSSQGEWERAARLLEKAADAIEAQPPAADHVATWFELARLYYLTRHYELAAARIKAIQAALGEPEKFHLDEATRKLILREPELTYQLFGECYLEAGDAVAAQAAFEQAETAKPNPPLAGYNQARVAAKRGQHEEALAALDRYCAGQLSSEGLAPYELLASLLEQTGRGGELLERLTKLQAADATNGPLRYFLATRLEAADRLDEAAAAYRQMVEPGAMRPPAEAFARLARLGLKQRKTEWLLTAAGAAAGRALSLAALDDADDELIADAELLGQFLDSASAQLAAQPPQLDFGGRVAAGLVAVTAKRLDVARTFWEAALAAEPARAAEVLSAWGLSLLVSEQYGDAAGVFQRAIDAHVAPDDSPAFYFYLAGALEMAGRTDEALTAARVVAERSPGAPRLLARLGWILTHAKRYVEARTAYRELLERIDARPESDDLRDVARECRLALSGLAVHLNDLPEAEEYLEQVLDEFPDDPGAQNDLGYLWADANKHLSKALTMIEVAVAAEPKNKAYRDSLGWVYYRLGRFDEAARELREAADQAEPDGVVLDHLGDALVRTGDAAGARDAWQRAIADFTRDGQGDKIPPVSAKIEQAAQP